MKSTATWLLLTFALFPVPPTLYADVGDQIGKLFTRKGGGRDDFGYSVAIHGSTAAVGARYYDAAGIDSNSGSAYIFDVASGTQTALLLPDDRSPSDLFGFSVGMDRDTVIVGAYRDDDQGLDSGSAYLFDAHTGTQREKLLPDDGNAGDEFGNSVAVDGTWAIVGAQLNDDGGTDSGSVYLFDSTTGDQLMKLLPNDGSAGDRFGISVSSSANRTIVGAYLDDDNGLDSGSAYVFDTGTGTQLAKLLPSDGAAGDYFGYSVRISGNFAIVGAPRDDDRGENSGSAYVFNISSGQQLAKLMAVDGEEGDEFGISPARPLAATKTKANICHSDEA